MQALAGNRAKMFGESDKGLVQKRAKMFGESDRGLVCGGVCALVLLLSFCGSDALLVPEVPITSLALFSVSVLDISSIVWAIQGYEGNATMWWDGPRTKCFMMTHRDSKGHRPSGDCADLFIAISLSQQPCRDKDIVLLPPRVDRTFG